MPAAPSTASIAHTQAHKTPSIKTRQVAALAGPRKCPLAAPGQAVQEEAFPRLYCPTAHAPEHVAVVKVVLAPYWPAGQPTHAPPELYKPVPHVIAWAHANSCKVQRACRTTARVHKTPDEPWCKKDVMREREGERAEGESESLREGPGRE